jgi:hypothetical protein
MRFKQHRHGRKVKFDEGRKEKGAADAMVSDVDTLKENVATSSF